MLWDLDVTITSIVKPARFTIEDLSWCFWYLNPLSSHFGFWMWLGPGGGEGGGEGGRKDIPSVKACAGLWYDSPSSIVHPWERERERERKRERERDTWLQFLRVRTTSSSRSSLFFFSPHHTSTLPTYTRTWEFHPTIKHSFVLIFSTFCFWFFIFTTYLYTHTHARALTRTLTLAHSNSQSLQQSSSTT